MKDKLLAVLTVTTLFSVLMFIATMGDFALLSQTTSGNCSGFELCNNTLWGGMIALQFSFYGMILKFAP